MSWRFEHLRRLISIFFSKTINLRSVTSYIMWRRITATASQTMRYLNSAKSPGYQRSNYSTTNQFIICSLDSKTGVATLKLNNPPVNCLSTKLIEPWLDTMRCLEQDPKCTALILASNIPGIFCAGLDFKEIHRPQREQYMNYHHLINQLWTSVFSSKLPTVAALNGSSIAFGCILAMCCDYRIMKTGKGTIGLPEVQMGIALKSWIAEIFVSLVGRRQGELGLTQGLLYNAEDALRIGLIDEVVMSEEELLKQAIKQAELLAGLPSEPRHKTKMTLRQPLLDSFEKHRAATEERIVDAVMSKQQQLDLDVYLEKLKARKKPVNKS